MKQIGIKKQPDLGLARTFSLTIVGVRYRLFRSIVTLSVVSVAIAFMMNVIGESVIKTTVVRSTRERVKLKRMVAEWTSKLSTVGALGTILREVAATRPDGPAWKEAQQMSGLDAQGMATFQKQAGRAAALLDEFSAMKYGDRRRLIHRATETAIFDTLAEPVAFDRFSRSLKAMRSVRFSHTPEEMSAFLDDWPALRSQTKTLQMRRREATQKIREGLGEKTLINAFADATTGFANEVRSAGFSLDDAAAAKLGSQAQKLLLTASLEKSIGNEAVLKMLASRFDVLPAEVNTGHLWRMLLRKKATADYVDTLRANGITGSEFLPKEILGLARGKREEGKLDRAERFAVDVGGGMLGIGQRMGWLVLISIIVCIVGIANVMLIAVTERFREIATLKCLGALDSYIMLSFMMEASLLGAVGGFFGSILGMMISVSRMTFVFGSLLYGSFPFQAMGAWMLAAMAVGIFLAVVASVYPSLKAARLAPMEAMRIE